MDRKIGIGLAATLGIWLTAGLALPFVNKLTMFTPEQLLAARGFLTATMALILARGKVITRDPFPYLIALCIPFASLGLFKGIRAWGAGPTLIIITATPVINFFVTIARGRRVHRTAITTLALILFGVVIARWGGRFNGAGLFWSIFGTVFNGILYELFAKAKGSTPLQRCFWGSLGIGALGFVLSASADWHQLIGNTHLQLLLITFAFVGGLLYWIANFLAFQYLPKDLASVLAQGETPAVIVMAWLLLGEYLTALQWAGVLISLYGAWRLTAWLASSDAHTHPPQPASP